MSSEQKAPVLIIGAGLAGLTLAQILRKNGIPAEVFERDDPDHVRSQGWAVMLVDCLPALSDLLPNDLDDLREVSVNNETKDVDSITFMNAKTLEIYANMGNKPYGQPGFGIRAHREHLRDLLSKHLTIHRAKNLIHYEEDDNGVTAEFKDGTTVRGSVLIGADGGHSHVRSQLLNEGPELSKQVNIVAQGNVGPEYFKPLKELASAVIVAVNHPVRIMLAQLSMKADRSSAWYYYFLAYRVDDPASETQWIANATKQDLFDKAMGLMKDSHPFLVDKLREMGPDYIALDPLKYVEYVTPEKMPQGKVTLIGDALHTMIPFKAAGANTALLDSCDLGRIIVQSYQDGEDTKWSEIFDQYYTIALPRGRKAVLESRAAGETDGRAAH